MMLHDYVLHTMWNFSHYFFMAILEAAGAANKWLQVYIIFLYSQRFYYILILSYRFSQKYKEWEQVKKKEGGAQFVYIHQGGVTPWYTMAPAGASAIWVARRPRHHHQMLLGARVASHLERHRKLLQTNNVPAGIYKCWSRIYIRNYFL